MTPDMLNIEACSSGCSDSGESGDEVGSFGDGVYYNHDCIMTRRFQEFNYKVYADRIPRSGRSRERLEFSDGEVSLSFGTEA